MDSSADRVGVRILRRRNSSATLSANLSFWRKVKATGVSQQAGALTFEGENGRI